MIVLEEIFASLDLVGKVCFSDGVGRTKVIEELLGEWEAINVDEWIVKVELASIGEDNKLVEDERTPWDVENIADTDEVEGISFVKELKWSADNSRLDVMVVFPIVLVTTILVENGVSVLVNNVEEENEELLGGEENINVDEWIVIVALPSIGEDNKWVEDEWTPW